MTTKNRKPSRWEYRKRREWEERRAQHETTATLNAIASRGYTLDSLSDVSDEELLRTCLGLGGKRLALARELAVSREEQKRAMVGQGRNSYAVVRHAE